MPTRYNLPACPTIRAVDDLWWQEKAHIELFGVVGIENERGQIASREMLMERPVCATIL